MLAELGEARAVPQMRKHVALYLKGVPGAAALRERIMRIDSAAEALETIETTIARLENETLAAA
jgi:tRNA-dihydrouridine synthase B